MHCPAPALKGKGDSCAFGKERIQDVCRWAGRAQVAPWAMISSSGNVSFLLIPPVNLEILDGCASLWAPAPFCPRLSRYTNPFPFLSPSPQLSESNPCVSQCCRDNNGPSFVLPTEIGICASQSQRWNSRALTLPGRGLWQRAEIKNGHKKENWLLNTEGVTGFVSREHIRARKALLDAAATFICDFHEAPEPLPALRCLLGVRFFN